MSKPFGSMAASGKNPLASIVFYDRYLVFGIIGLITLGLLMVYSSSIVISERMFGHPFHFVLRQLGYLTLGGLLALFVVRIKMTQWQAWGSLLLVISLFLLTLVLIPGIGRQVNGSMRWLGISVIGLQVSEFAKLAVVIYLAGYLVRREQEIKTHVSGFIKPMAILGLMGILLLREPDFGATTVIMVTSLGMMFLAGVRVWQFLVLLVLVVAALGILAISSPYRLARLTTFLNPWANQFDSGYQLTQSLIAFGRGGWFGVGLGESIQKLFYLPEAHTDFLFAVLAEELGLFGVLAVIVLFAIVVARILIIGRHAYLQGKYFSSYAAYGFGLWIAMQAMVNIGVNAGVLPTKGLTLPLMSYGGSSMLIMCIVFAIILRIDYEIRTLALGLTKSRLPFPAKKLSLHANSYKATRIGTK